MTLARAAGASRQPRCMVVGGAGASARKRGVVLIGTVIDVRADSRRSPVAAVGDRPVRGEQRLDRRQNGLALVRLGPDLDLHGEQPKGEAIAGR
jgi:hypothetical protein